MNTAIERGIIPPSSGDLLMAERVQQEVVSGKIPGLSRVIRDAKFQIAAGLSLLAAITAACAPAQAKEGQDIILNPNNPTPAASAPQEIPTSKPPATAEANPPTPTPEVKKLAECGIVDPKYCQYAEVIDWKNPDGSVIKIIGFRFPKEVKVPIYSPIKGQVTKVPLNGSTGFNGIETTIFSPDLPDSQRRYYMLEGPLAVTNMLTVDVNGGQIIGYSSSGDEKAAGNFDLIYYIIMNSTIDETTARDQFPDAFQKPSVTLSNLKYREGDTSYTDTFYSKKP